MNCDNASLLLYAVTDRSWLHGQTLYAQAEQALQGGATFLQLREKELDEAHFKEEAIALKALCKQYGVPFVLDDNVALAIETDADGVHVGQSDMAAGKVRELIGPDKILGVSAQTVEEALLAEREGADYLGVGAVFPTGTKADANAVSYDTLRDICAAVSIPVIAIGGITKDNVARLSGSGIVGVAVVSAIFAYIQRQIGGTTFRRSTKLMLKRRQNMKTALTIAGSDSSGGAGIQADLKAMTMNGVFAMSAITALTAQNTTGVQGIFEVSPAFLGQQIDSVFTDIRPDAVKIGMVASSGLIEVIAERLQHYGAKNIVVDPVMGATSGARLISEDAIATLEARLLPLATVLTPNIPEAEVLSGLSITSPDDMIAAGKIISERYGCAVLCKGGHRLNDANDLLYRDGGYEWFNGKRIDNPNTHGTGCTLSSAIAANLAKGFDLDTAVRRAKDYLSGALAAMLDLGAGSGPMDHAFDLKPEYRQEA